MSTGLLIILCLAFIILVVVQIGKISELASKIRGEEESQYKTNNWQGFLMLVFMVIFLGLCIWSSYYYKNWMLSYGPHKSASAHGVDLDFQFNLTLVLTGIVFILTHIALFYFAYKYRGKKGVKSAFLPHNDKLEIWWTAIPFVTLCFLVINGIITWNEVTADVKDGDDYMEIEAVGAQFLWYLRYPGTDGALGPRDYKLITGRNPLGQNWMDDKNLDDFQPTDMVLPVNKKVRVRITARDVIHSFYLPHFRVKMDAVPGMPTYFVFTPTRTTEEYRNDLSKYPEYQQLSDPDDPESEPLWKTFNYELACAELCGKGHFSMRKVVRIVSQEEYDKWVKEQQSYYLSTIRGTNEDPRKDELLGVEITQRAQDFSQAVEKALAAENAEEKIIRLNYVYFETGSAKLTDISRYELSNLGQTMAAHPNMTIEVAGHTDNVGDPAANLSLSQERARAVYDYLVNNGNVPASRMTVRGYGQIKPIDTNETEEGRAKNRRTEFQILTQ